MVSFVRLEWGERLVPAFNFTVQVPSMSLVPVLTPDSEAELATIVAMLEARGVPCFVRGAGIGSLLPGVQVESFNSRTIMVPADRATEALTLIADVVGSPDSFDDKPPPPPPLRTLAEWLLFGWFVPGRREPKR